MIDAKQKTRHDCAFTNRISTESNGIHGCADRGCDTNAEIALSNIAKRTDSASALAVSFIC